MPANARTGKHGPCKLSSYLRTHNTILNGFVTRGFCRDHVAHFTPIPPDMFWFVGWIACKGSILITFEKKLLAVDEREAELRVQTEMYAYNASIQGGHNILRYDNQHPERLYPGHNDPHHKHLFDWTTDANLSGSPFWIGESNWPTLGEVVGELEQWHADHYAQLSAPQEYAILPRG